MSFEVFTRPFITPPIRLPAKPPVLPFQDTPERGVAVLRGQGGKLIDLTTSETSSWSKTRMVEKQRTVDVERVYQKEPDGKVNKENYVDVERATQIIMIDPANGQQENWDFQDRPAADNVETIEENLALPNRHVPKGEVEDDREPNVG